LEVEMLALHTNLRSRRARRIALVAFVACVGPITTSAATQVYHSPGDDGVPAVGQATLPAGGVQSVFLYIDGGATVSGVDEACDTGAGDELCGFEFGLDAVSGLTLSSFSPDGGVDLVSNLSAGSIKINGLDTVSPSPGPHRLGELQVNSVAGGVLALYLGETVNADLSESRIPITAVVAVPEPGHLALLGSGLLMLSALYRRSARR
jgi:hypothetical protein